ncbi:MAG: hypothetical protein KJO06_06155 [Gemmatimonadetes bacterium]|nr:hypothetical protein [Gemmatimonadota bacterium]
MNTIRENEGGRLGLVVCAVLGMALTSPVPAAAQNTAMPHFPNGTTVVLVPVQSTLPLDDGSWPGLARTEEDALRAMDAELEFAFRERRSAEDWILPSDLRRTMERNPSLDIKPDRMAYSPLLVPIDDRKYIPEPLHSELRTLAALYDTRYVVVPVRLTVETESTDGGRSGSAVAYSGGDAVAPAQRAYLLAAMIDIRRSDVLWLGEFVGDPGTSDSGSLLATLANQVAEKLAP